MEKKFNYYEARNMVISVCSGYLQRDEMKDYFKENFAEDKMFDSKELKQIVHDLTEDKIKRTKSLNETWKGGKWGNSGKEER